MGDVMQVTIDEVTDFTIFQIACWPDTLGKMGSEAAMMTGVDAAPLPGQSATGEHGALLRIEPLKWWLVCASNAQLPDIDGELGAVLDLTASRIRLRVAGPRAADLLNRFLPINLSDQAFPDGAVGSTGFHHVGVTLWRQGNAFDLFLPRSFAASLIELLEASAEQFR